MPIAERLISAILFATAGGCVFLVLLNRVLLTFRDSQFKSVMIILISGIMTMGGTIVGYATGFSIWLIFPLVVLAGIIIGEIQRTILRFQAKGIYPDETINARIHITRPFTRTDLALMRYSVPFPEWRGQPFRIVHISDLHLTSEYPSHYYDDILYQIDTAHPDLLFMTGDFVTRAQYISLLPDFLTSLNGICQTFAVLGNHDYWAGADEIASIARDAGIELLRDECRTLELNGGTLRLCGDESPLGHHAYSYSHTWNLHHDADPYAG